MKLNLYIIEWIRLHVFIDVPKLEQIGLGLSPKSRPVNRALKGYQDMPEKHIPALLPILCQYGFYLMVDDRKVLLFYDGVKNAYYFNKQWVGSLEELCAITGYQYGKKVPLI